MRIEIFCTLLGVAGGPTNLSKMPACNILLLGAQKRTLSGFSTTAILPHTGFIYYSEFVQKMPQVSDWQIWFVDNDRYDLFRVTDVTYL